MNEIRNIESALATRRQTATGLHKFLLGQDNDVSLTKSTPYKPLPLPEIAANIRELYACAVAHPHLTFLVTPVGCGLAGYAVGEIAELFTDPPDNLVFLNDWNKNV